MTKEVEEEGNEQSSHFSVVKSGNIYHSKGHFALVHIETGYYHPGQDIMTRTGSYNSH
ncbi:MAG: hypothetical protein UMV23_04075 [Halanaerobium sp.]|nr:hypothetical protein [Halanaerobium sp.]